MIRAIVKTAITVIALLPFLFMSACNNSGADPENATDTKAEETSVTLPETETEAVYPANTAPDPRNPRDLIVYLCNVTDFGAVADGTTDNTKAFQDALDYAYRQGGGTVFVPAGRYFFKGTIKIPRSVYLAGEWTDPEDNSGAIADGTVLIVTSGKGSVSGTPFITIGASAGVIGLTVIYPEQYPYVTKPVPYPATILIKDNYAGDGTQHASSIECVTLVNSFFGIDGTQGNQLFYINTARITAFDRGFAVNKCYDCGRTMNLSVSPRYCAYFASASGETLSADDVAKITKANTTGIVMMRTDWQMMYKTQIESCRVGVSCERNPESDEETAGNGSLIDFEITDCTIGIDCYYGSFQFSQGQINATGDGAVCVRINPTVVGNFSFYDCELSSVGLCVQTVQGNTGVLSVQNCRFNGWADRAIGHFGGSLEVQSSVFSGAGEAIYADAGALTLVSSGNVYSDKVASQIVCNLTGDNTCVIDEVSQPLPTVDFSTDIGTPPVIENVRTIVYVTDFGATGKAVCGSDNPDDTDAFRAAIAAATDSGGIVYVPAGYYNVEGTLAIPAGVELRGISQSMHVTTGEGSVIFVTSGAGDEEGTPFITLEEGAGLRGLTFWYPDQNYKKIVRYPWLIRVAGKNTYIRNVCVGNCYKAIDMASHDSGGHRVENITGCILKNGIALDGSTSAGHIINTHFNLSFYTAVWGTKLTDASDSFGSSDMFPTLINYIGSNLTAYSFGTATDETVLYAFNYRAAVGMRFTGGFDGRLCGSGVDGSVVGLYITGKYDTPLRMLNFADDIVPGSSKIGNVGVYIDAEEGSEIALISSSASSYNYVPPYLVTLVSGKLTLQGFCANVSPVGSSAALLIRGGDATVSGITFRHVGPLDAKGGFTVQTEKSRAMDVRVKAGRLTLRGATAKYFFAAKDEGEITSFLQYVIAK